jgi:hypothetical protein
MELYLRATSSEPHKYIFVIKQHLPPAETAKAMPTFFRSGQEAPKSQTFVEH